MRGAAGLIGVLGISAGVSACAAPPESVAQSVVSPIYNDLTCFDLADELEQVNAALTQMPQQQEQAQGSDVPSTVSMIGVPKSTLSSTDAAPQLGREQQQAIQHAMAQKQCRVALDVERMTSWRSKN